MPQTPGHWSYKYEPLCLAFSSDPCHSSLSGVYPGYDRLTQAHGMMDPPNFCLRNVSHRRNCPSRCDSHELRMEHWLGGRGWTFCVGLAKPQGWGTAFVLEPYWCLQLPAQLLLSQWQGSFGDLCRPEAFTSASLGLSTGVSPSVSHAVCTLLTANPGLCTCSGGSHAHLLSAPQACILHLRTSPDPHHSSLTCGLFPFISRPFPLISGHLLHLWTMPSHF